MQPRPQQPRPLRIITGRTTRLTREAGWHTCSLSTDGRYFADMDKSGVSLIRPFIYLEEYDIKSAVKRQNLPIVNNPCPMNHESQREYMKNLIKTICKDIPFAKQRILGAIYHPERNNLWQKPEN